MKVVWDQAKDRANRKKHGVSFAEAQALLSSEADEVRLDILDDTHSADEDRFISIGPIARGLVLVVWTERREDVVRIISARWATRRESELYAQHFGGES